jgi:hypothetical protein
MADADLPPRPLAHWLHLLLLIALVSALELGRTAAQADSVFVYSVFARALYNWLPALAGIAISISGPHARISRDGVLIGLAAVVVMITLDVTGGLAMKSDQRAALLPDASIMADASRLASASWVQTAIAWLRGELALTAETSPVYGLDDPRLRAVQAITEGSLALVVFGSIGMVIAAMSWVRAHVVFKRPQDAKAFHVVIAWFIAPVVVELSNALTRTEQFRALFRGTALWRPAVPRLVLLAAGLFAWWYSARYREMGDA